MIFVTVGTDPHNFNRLIEYIESLKLEKVIKEQVILQYGYTPISQKVKGINYIDFCPSEKFRHYLKQADFIISHGGLGNILQAINLKKKVIVVPRIKKFNEHENDHQLEISEQLSLEKKVLLAQDKASLARSIKNIKKFHPNLQKHKNLAQSLVLNFINKFK